MPQTAITIVGSLDKSAENRAAALIREVSGESSELRILAPGRAIDVILAAGGAALEAALRQKLSSFGAFDIFVQPQDAFRKKRLLVADMDATMIEGEIMNEIAARAGIEDKIVPITEAGMRGEIDFRESLTRRVALMKGLSTSILTETLAEVRPSKGAATLVKTMRRFGAQCVLVSGGFDFFTRPIAEKIGFNKSVGNRFDVHNGSLTGEVIPPIIDKDAKKKTLEDEARLLQIDLRATAAVGDGANDVPMLQAAGAGIGYFGKPAVQAATPHQIRHTDMTAILFMQGYRQEDFAA